MRTPPVGADARGDTYVALPDGASRGCSPNPLAPTEPIDRAGTGLPPELGLSFKLKLAESNRVISALQPVKARLRPMASGLSPYRAPAGRQSRMTSDTRSPARNRLRGNTSKFDM